jgi:hypothetical protein
MKARNKKTRWLLLALLFGILAVAGLTLTRHHGAPSIAKANDTTAPRHTLLQQPVAALLAGIGGKHAPWAPAGAGRDEEPVASPHSRVTGPSGSPPHTSNADPVGASSVGTQPRSNPPATSATNHLPQNGAGEFVYDGYAPLDCELPAGCGASGGTTGSVSHPPAETSGVLPFAHNPQGSTPSDGSNPPPNSGSNPPPNNSNNSGQGSGSPGQKTNPPSQGPNPPVASAPELDPATLAGAVTLLLGSLAVIRSRRVRATR